MRTAAEVDRVLALDRSGHSATAIARITGVPRGTVRDWLAGKLPHSSPLGPDIGTNAHDLARLPRSYAYLLGIYLGDGCISIGPRSVARIRIHLDLRYPRIIEECKRAIADLLPANAVHVQLRGSRLTGRDELTNAVVSAYSKSWPRLIPQHGPGLKHNRPIELRGWQEEYVRADPGLFLRGLIHSDGCRFTNTGTNWRHPRYSFSNQSADIRGLFVWACELLNLHCTFAPHTVYVSRMVDVAVLDQYVGPKR